MQLKSLLSTAAYAAVLSLLTLGSQKVAAQAVEVSLPIVVEDVGETVQIPVTVDDVTGKDITTFFLEIEFDPAIIEFSKSITKNTLSDVSGSGKFDGSNVDGEFTVAYAAPASRPISGSGTLVLLEATVLAEGSTDLSFQLMQFNDGDVPSNTTNGLFSTQEPASSNLGVTLTASPSPAVAGGAFTLAVAVANAGPDAATGVETVITLPGSVTYTSGTSGCSHDAGTVTCTRSSLASGASATHTLTLEASSATEALDFSAAVTSASTDPQVSNDSASLTITVESDQDGVPDETEAEVPNRDGDGTGDGNGDGIPDKEQENVASLPNATGDSYVTIEAPDGAVLTDVSVTVTPPAGAPPVPNSLLFGDGFIDFEVDVDAGAATIVTIYTTQEVNSYVKYGPTPENSTPHWYEFLYDGTTGAEIMDDHVVLHLVDGARGDADLSANGVVDDPGGPVFSTNAAPVASDDDYTVDEDATLTVEAGDGLLQNDSDPNEDNLQVSLVSGVENGILDLDVDGSFTYTPDENFNGVDAFVYAVSDGFLTDTAEVTIAVNAVNDAPEESVILSPIAGSTITIGAAAGENPADGEAELINITWTEVDDPEGDDVTYTLVVGQDEDFSTVIDQFDADAATELSVSVAQGAAWFDAVHGDAELGASATVYLRVVSSDGGLETEGEAKSLTLVRGTITSTDRAEVPNDFALQGNYPNPFNPSTQIVFDLPEQAHVTIDIYDALGRRVLGIPVESVAAGAGRSVDVDASALPSGAYIYRITAEMSTFTKVVSGVMTLMK